MSWHPRKVLRNIKVKLAAWFLPEQKDVTPDFWTWWKYRVAHVRSAVSLQCARASVNIYLKVDGTAMRLHVQNKLLLHRQQIAS